MDAMHQAQPNADEEYKADKALALNSTVYQNSNRCEKLSKLIHKAAQGFGKSLATLVYVKKAARAIYTAF